VVKATIERRRWSRAELAGLVGVAPKTLAAWSKFPSFPVPDNQDRFCGVEFLLWWVERKAAKAVTDQFRAKLSIEVSAASAEPVSQEDEFRTRQLRAKALQAELALESEQKSLVRVADVQQHIEAVTRSLRAGCEVLQRRFGEEASEILERAIAEAESELKRLN
jgi:hypothetical protein